MGIDRLISAGALHSAEGMLRQVFGAARIDRESRDVNALIANLRAKYPPQPGDNYNTYRTIMRRAVSSHNTAKRLNEEDWIAPVNQHALSPAPAKELENHFRYEVLLQCYDEDGEHQFNTTVDVYSKERLSGKEILTEASKLTEDSDSGIFTRVGTPKKLNRCDATSSEIIGAQRYGPAYEQGPLSEGDE